MNKRVEGVYPVVDEALRAVDRLRAQGYSRDEITLVANEDTRRNLSSDVNAEVSSQDEEMNRSDDDDGSFWDSIKDAFTMDESYDDANYDDPNYDSENDPVYEHREAISRGDVAVLVDEDANVEGTTDQSTRPPHTDSPGTPGTRNPNNPNTGNPGTPNTPNPNNPDTVNPDSTIPDPRKDNDEDRRNNR